MDSEKSSHLKKEEKQIKKDPRFKAELLLLLLSVWFGLRLIVIKEVIVFYDINFVNATRFILACLFALIFLRKNLLFNKITLKIGVFSGLTMAVSMWMQTYALQFTDVGKASFLCSVYIIMVPLLVWLRYRIKPSRRNIISLAVCFTGVALLSLNGDFALSLPDILLLMSAVFAAISIIAAERGGKLPEVNIMSLSFSQLASCALFFVILTLIRGGIPRYTTPSLIMNLFFIGFICAGIGNPVWMRCVKCTTASRASIFMALESVFAAVFGILLLNESLSFKAVLGAAAIFSASVFTVSDNKMPRMASIPVLDSNTEKP